MASSINLYCLFSVWCFCVCTIITSTCRRKLEAINGKWKIMIIWIVHKESVVDIFLETLCFITFWHEWTSRSWGCALFNASSLGQGFVMCLDSIYDDSPFTSSVDSTEGLNISGFGWAEIGFFYNILQAGYRVIGISQNILVHLLN